MPDRASPDPKAHGPFAAIRRVLPSSEVVRFLLVGGVNTVFAFVLYSGCVKFLGHLSSGLSKPIVADIAFAISTPIGITSPFCSINTSSFAPRATL